MHRYEDPRSVEDDEKQEDDPEYLKFEVIAVPPLVDRVQETGNQGPKKVFHYVATSR